MHETVTLSLSHYANHVSTHLYNNQESHLSYRKGVSSNYDNEVYLTSNKTAQGTTNYNPRAILYDLNGGTGSLGKYEYYEPEIRGKRRGVSDHDDDESSLRISAMSEPAGTVDIFKLPQQVPKNSFQTALDTGSVKSGLLNVENTRYWSDYNKLIYKPSSLQSLTNWVHDATEPWNNGYSKNGTERKFDNYTVGINEYKNEATHIDGIETFRAFLEDCDLFQGINMLTEVDSAWGGFSNELLVDIKDEYFNNGGEGKYSFWVWATYNNDLKLSTASVLSRIKTTLELIKSSTLYFGMGSSPNHSLSRIIDTSAYSKTSLWHSSSLKAAVIDNLWSLNNQDTMRVSMSRFESELLRGDTNRNIVSEINLHQQPELAAPCTSASDNAGFSMVDVPRNAGEDVYAMYAQAINEQQTPSPNVSSKSNYIDFTDSVYESKKGSKFFSKSYVVAPDCDVDLAELNKKQMLHQHPFPITQYDMLNPSTLVNNYTFPREILTQATEPMFTEFGISTKPRELLQEFSKILQRSSRITARGGSFNFDKFEFEEMLEDTNNLLDEYTYDWEEDDEDWD